MEFKERIKELRAHKKISAVYLANELGKSESAIRMWETGKAKPDADTLIKLTELFDVTSDYLLGIQAAPKRSTSDIMDITGLSQEAVEKLEFYFECLNSFKLDGDLSPRDIYPELGTINDLLCYEKCDVILKALHVYLYSYLDEKKSYGIGLEQYTGEEINNGRLFTINSLIKEWRNQILEKRQEYTKTYEFNTKEELDAFLKEHKNEYNFLGGLKDYIERDEES